MATVGRIEQEVGRVVELRGWVYNSSSKGKLHFIQLRDGTGTIQCVVFQGNVSEAVFENAGHLTQETAIIVRGEVVEDKRSRLGFELQVNDLEVIHRTENYPITPKEHGTNFLMDHRHLWMRSARQHAVLRVRHELIRAIREFFDERDFINADAPIFTPTSVEGTTTLFATDYFDETAYLTQSGQLYNEATAMAFGKVYCFGPTFRAEKSKTRRHLTEFWMVEPEVAWMELDEDMELAEDFLLHLVTRVLERRRPELELLERDISKLEAISKPFPRISYDEAVGILREEGVDFTWGDDFGGSDETVISSRYDNPVIVHRYPAALKPFYMKHDPNDPRLALNMDVLAPEGYGEIIGGGQREDNYDLLLERLRAEQLPEAAYDWYLDLRRYGSVPHSGFGLGVERTITWLTGISHLREAIPFPRLISRLKP
ncbi:MAG: asparagine--tRNA ligase [Candidatus Delongbacteria bacterium]|nr:asparagine--tRNA ligase [Candidatus Delongbacteria bacterium]